MVLDTTGYDIYPLIQRHAAENGISERLLLAMLIAESGLNPYAARYGTPPDVSFGYSQLIITTAAAYGIGDGSYTEENVERVRDTLFDRETSIRLGAAHLKWTYYVARLYPEERELQALICYNSGNVQERGNWYWQRYGSHVAAYQEALLRAEEMLS